MTDKATPQSDSQDDDGSEAFWRFRAFVSSVLAVPKTEVDLLQEQEEVARVGVQGRY